MKHSAALAEFLEPPPASRDFDDIEEAIAKKGRASSTKVRKFKLPDDTFFKQQRVDIAGTARRIRVT